MIIVAIREAKVDQCVLKWVEDLPACPPACPLILGWSIVGASSIPLLYLVKSTLCLLVGFVLGFLGDAQKVKDYLCIYGGCNGRQLHLRRFWFRHRCSNFCDENMQQAQCSVDTSYPEISVQSPKGSIVFHILLLFLNCCWSLDGDISMLIFLID